MKEKVKNKLQKCGEYGITSSGIDYDIFVNDGNYFVVVSAQGKKFSEKSKQVFSEYQELASYVFEDETSAIQEFVSILEANGISL